MFIKHLCRSACYNCVVTSSIKLPSSSDSELAWLLGLLLSYRACSWMLTMRSIRKERIFIRLSSILALLKDLSFDYDLSSFASFAKNSDSLRDSKMSCICVIVGRSTLLLSSKICSVCSHVRAKSVLYYDSSPVPVIYK